MMSFFNFFKDEIFEFERTYDYHSEVFDIYSEETEAVEGIVTFHGEVYWDNIEEVFHYELYTSGSTLELESNFFAGYDVLENRFLDEYKNYLVDQGVPSSNIAWLQIENRLGAVNQSDENGYVEDDYRIDYLQKHI